MALWRPLTVRGMVVEPRRVIPAAPGDLEAAGLAVWEVAWSLPRVEPADGAMVEQLARLQDEAAQLRAALASDGMVLRKPIQNSKGQRTKTNLATVAALKGAGASATEAQTAVQALKTIADDPETTASDLRCRAAELQQELAMNPGDTARREALMQRAAAVAARYGPSA